jgi:uncharacterized protein with beta-barrel porin domain
MNDKMNSKSRAKKTDPMPPPVAPRQGGAANPFASRAIGDNWVKALALPIVLPLGVALPHLSYAQVTFPGASGPINLADYGTATSFYFTRATTVISSQQVAVYGPASMNWTITNAGTIDSVASYGVKFAGGGTVTNSGVQAIITGAPAGVAISGSGIVSNDGTITGTAGYGVELLTTGTVTNTSTAAAISGTSSGVVIAGGGTVSNAGVIAGRSEFGVSLPDGGSVINSGAASTITGGVDGIHVSNGPGTITNFGTVSSTGVGAGIYLASGGSITNSGVISGAIGIVVTGGNTRITNAGTIFGNTTSIQFGNGNDVLQIEPGASFFGIVDGGGGTNTLEFGAGAGMGTFVGLGSAGFTNFSIVEVDAGANWTFASSNTIAAGVSLTDAGTLTNTGMLVNAGTLSVSGSLINSGMLTGQVTLTAAGALNNTGTIASSTDAVYGVSGAVTVTNAGTITGNARYGVLLGAGGTVTNTGTSSVISGGLDGVRVSGQAGTVSNQGTISGMAEAGIDLGAGGTVTNSGTQATITGQLDGVAFDGSGTIFNDGTIVGTAGFGVDFSNGGTLTNTNRSASVSGAGGVMIGGAGAVNNAGTIVGTGAYGVQLASGGSVVNSGTASKISGALGGVLVQNGAGTITNGGTISSSGGAGVTLTGGGSINNSGLISGNSEGITVTGGNAQITNTGTIVATGANGIGVLFCPNASGTIDNAGTIDGAGGTAIKFSGGTNVLIIESGGVLSGIADGTDGNNTLLIEGTGHLDGAQIVGFRSTQFSGTSTLDTTTSVVNATVANGASIVNQGTLTGSLNVANGGVLDNPGTITVTTASTIGGVLTSEGTFSNSSVLTNSGSLSNSGSLTNSGTLNNAGGLTNIGVLTNNGAFANTGTLINNGTINGTGTLSSSANVINSGSITGNTNGITGSGSITNTGTIIGTAGVGVQMTGAGTLTNAARALIQGGQYGIQVGTGDTVNNAGTIVDDAIAGAALGSGAVVNNNGSIGGVTGVVFTGTGATLNNSGTISGSGGVAVQFDAGANSLSLGTGTVLDGNIDGGGGAGQITLTGSGTLTNTITNFGAGSALNIASGASWIASGNWSIASVTNAGLFQAGTLTTPLQLTGNFTQMSGATLQVSVGGNGNASKFVIDGIATLAGTLALVPVTGTFTVPDTRYTILTASGGVNGAFSNATFSNALLAPNLTFDPNDVVVTFKQLPVSAATSVPLGGGTPNQRATAAALDEAVKASPAAFAATLTGLDQMTAAQVRASLDRLSGESHASLPTIALMAGEQFVNQFQQQSTLARLGDSATAAGRDAAAAGGRQQLASLSGTPSTDPWANLSLPWGIWAAGYGQTGHLDGDGNTHGLSESVTGAAIGADYKVNPALRLGLAVGYGSAAYSLDDGGGSGDVNYTQVGVYSNYTTGPVYLDGMVGVAVGDGSTTRDASLPGSPAQAHADVSSTEVLGGVEAGYRLPLTRALTLTPFAGLSFGTVWQNSFTESGAGARDLSTQNQSQSSVKSTLGARLAADVPVSRWLVASSIQVGWSHEFAPTDRNTTASFAGLPSTVFTVAGAKVPGNSAMVAVGLSTRVSAGGSFNLHYDGYFSGSGTSNAVTGSFRYVW